MWWDGEDVEAYLDFAEKAGVEIVYLREMRLDASQYEEDAELQRHDGEVGRIELGFFKNDLFHLFDWEADWADGLFAEDEEEAEGGETEREGPELETSDDSAKVADERKLGEALTAKGPELVSSFVDHLSKREEPPPDPTDGEWIRREFVWYLADQLDLPTRKREPLRTGVIFNLYDEERKRAFLDPVVDKAVKQAAVEAARLMRDTEKKLVEDLVMKCVEWSKSQDIPLRSLTQQRVSEFLEERKIRLSRSGLRELRDRATIAIKRGRGIDSHHA